MGYTGTHQLPLVASSCEGDTLELMESVAGFLVPTSLAPIPNPGFLLEVSWPLAAPCTDFPNVFSLDAHSYLTSFSPDVLRSGSPL